MSTESDKKLELKIVNPEDKKQGKVVAVCPSCKKKIRKGDPAAPIQMALFVNKQLTPSIISVVCLGCGVMFFGNDELELIRKNVTKGQQMVVLAPQGAIVPRKDN